MTTVNDSLRSLVGLQIAGGCDYCEATQEMSPQQDGIFHMQVQHDDNCPDLARRQGRDKFRCSGCQEETPFADGRDVVLVADGTTDVLGRGVMCPSCATDLKAWGDL